MRILFQKFYGWLEGQKAKRAKKIKEAIHRQVTEDFNIDYFEDGKGGAYKITHKGAIVSIGADDTTQLIDRLVYYRRCEELRLMQECSGLSEEEILKLYPEYE